MTTNNFNEKTYFSEGIQKIFKISPENLETYMADDLVKEWERIRSVTLSVPELDFGEDRGINDIPKDNVILKLNTPEGGLVIKLFEGEDDKEDSWELRVIINHPAKARIMSNIAETFKRFPDSCIFWDKSLVMTFLKKSNIEKEFNDIYELFHTIVQYRTFLYKKYTSYLLKVFDCNEIFFNKENRGILARRYSNGRKEIVLEGFMTTVPKTDIPIYKLRTYDNNLYKTFDDNNWKKFTSLVDAGTYILARNKNYKEISEDKNKTGYTLEIQNALKVLIVDGLNKPSLSSVFSESYFKDYTKIENKLLEIVNDIYEKCNPSSISVNNVNEYLNNCTKIRSKIERILNSVISYIKGLVFDVNLSGSATCMVCNLRNENKFDIESLEKNYLNIFDSRTGFGKMCTQYLHIEGTDAQENKNIEILVNFAFSLFYLYNNLTLNMDYDIYNGMIMRVKKGDPKDKYTLLRKLDDIMNNKTNLLTKYKEEEKESTVGNY